MAGRITLAHYLYSVPLLALAIVMGWAMLPEVGAGLAELVALPDLDIIREWIRKIQQMLALGGIALALACSMVFIGAWVLSHLRRAKAEDEVTGSGWLSKIALASSFVPVALTLAAAVGLFVPLLKPLMLKLFAYAVVAAAISWTIGIAAVLAGGGQAELSRARRALLLAGTPFYCLAVWIGRFL